MDKDGKHKYDPEMFFPERGASTKAAKALCARCPVNTHCEDYANRTRTEYGIWGGVTRKRSNGFARMT